MQIEPQCSVHNQPFQRIGTATFHRLKLSNYKNTCFRDRSAALGCKLDTTMLSALNCQLLFVMTNERNLICRIPWTLDIDFDRHACMAQK